jgi:hypothetical protein
LHGVTESRSAGRPEDPANTWHDERHVTIFDCPPDERTYKFLNASAVAIYCGQTHRHPDVHFDTSPDNCNLDGYSDNAPDRIINARSNSRPKDWNSDAWFDKHNDERSFDECPDRRSEDPRADHRPDSRSDCCPD